MSWVDIVVVLLAIAAAISGWRHGLAVAALSFLGVIGGALVGLKIAPLVVGLFEGDTSRVVVSVLISVVVSVLTCVADSAPICVAVSVLTWVVVRVLIAVVVSPAACEAENSLRSRAFRVAVVSALSCVVVRPWL